MAAFSSARSWRQRSLFVASFAFCVAVGALSAV